MASPTPAAASGGGSLPVHLPTILLGLWRRRALPLVFTAAAAVVGVVVALGFGERQYASETVLLYRPTVATDASSSAQTVVNLVKITPNLEAVRERLKGGVSVPALAASYAVAAQKNTDLISIRATAPTAPEAALRANTLRDVFLESQARLAKDKSERQVRLLQARLDEANRRLAAADQLLIDAGAKNGIVDLDKQTGSYLQHEMSVDLLYQQALAERTAVDEQDHTLDKAAAALRRRTAQEQKDGPQDDPSALAARIGRLRSAIEEDRKGRVAQAELAKKEADLKRAELLAREGLIAQAELERVRADYESQKAMVVDTEQIAQWKQEMKKLDAGVVPTPSSGLLREVQTRRLDLGLQKVAMDQKVKQLDAARGDVKAKVAQLPELQRRTNELKREIESVELEKKSFEELLAKAKAASGGAEADFTVVSAAKPPIFPIESSRYPLLLAIVALGAVLGLGLAVLDEARDLTVRSGAEVPLKLDGARALTVIPKLPPGLAVLPDGRESPMLEAFRRLTRELRRALPDRGTRILVVSATEGEGTTFVAAHLAAAFGRQDERVLLLDAALRHRAATSLADHAIGEDPLDGGAVLPRDVEERLLEAARRSVEKAGGTLQRAGERVAPHLPEKLLARAEKLPPRASAAGRAAAAAGRASLAFLRGLLPRLSVAPSEGLALAALAPAALAPAPSGLAGYLSYEADSLADVTRPTPLVGVACLPSAGETPVPDLIASRRMGAMLDEASERFSVVVVDASPVLASADAEILAESMDAVLLVVRSQGPSAATVKKAVRRLKATGVAIAGVVLNRADRVYLSCSGDAVL
ncbi:MAG: hypothetical protein U0599_06405 [Vicinamibacteria bacterium]